ncbi:MAG: DNA gyrase subunit A [Candidatus Meridianibacter frigidus]|nr:MAG: DNA gyrase subunit A [Candidatus Eremiobacteraeota bacterium]
MKDGAGSSTLNNDIISAINVEDEMRASYLSYAMSVIASRALPDVRDGLKPVQRRILFAMREMGMDPTKQHRKCAGIIGEVLKSYHPHGDSSVYDALVRMAQDFTLRYPLVDGHGNFGSIDPDPPAAYRYTEARLARPALDVLADIDKETVPFIANFDNQGTEPSVLPGRLPQLLINGSSGIAVGMATNIPPHNLSEIADAVAALIDEPNLEDLALCEIVKGPDFPTGGMVLGHEAIKQAYLTGRGSVIMRGRAEIIEDKGKHKIVITQIPYQVSKNRIVEAIAEAHSEKRIAGIVRLDDESNRKGMRVVVELARSATPNVVLNQLYKHTPLQSSFGFNMLALVPAGEERHTEGTNIPIPLEPQVLSLKGLLEHYITHRKDVIAKRTRYDLRKAEERAHLLEGYRIALDNIDAVIKLIRASETVDDARAGLVQKFKLTEIQANAIVDMRLRTLTGLERGKIEAEYTELLKTIAELQDILASPRRIASIVKTEALDLKRRFGDERRTEIAPAEDEFSIEQLIPDTEVVVTYTVGGYIKRVSVDTFRQQNRGGRGVIGISNLKREDVVRNFFMTTTHQHVLFFTNKGRTFRLRAYEIPDTSRQARGTALVNLLTLPPGEEVTAVLSTHNFEGDRYMVMVTEKGVIKKTKLQEFSNVRRNGLIAINLDEGDNLLAVDLSDGSRDVILGTKLGMAVHFNEKNVRPMGRPARGVRAMTLERGDTIVAMDILEDERKEVLIVTSQAFGKRTPIADYRHTSRGGKGVKAFAREKDIGHVVDQILVAPEDQVLMITSVNQVIRLKVSDIRKAGRSTKGVRLQRLQAGDEVIAITNLGKQSAQISEITGEPQQTEL